MLSGRCLDEAEDGVGKRKWERIDDKLMDEGMAKRDYFLLFVNVGWSFLRLGILSFLIFMKFRRCWARWAS